MKKNILLIVGLVLIVCGCLIVLNMKKPNYEKKYGYQIIDNEYNSYKYITSYDEYLKFKDENLDNEYNFDRADTNNKELTEDNFAGPYLLYTILISGCNESIENHYLNYSSNHYELYFDVSYGCGICSPVNKTFIYKVHTLDSENEIDVKAYSKTISRDICDPNIAYKPIIYIYPNKDMDLSIKLGNSNNLLYTYPKYKDSWNIRVSADGNIYDYDTNRNYYGLYWEAYDDYKLDMSTGFVVDKDNIINFLEEKLEILGLNEYEINEFIIYWIDKLDSNYIFVSFRDIIDINKSMPLIISEKPDTLIRVMVDFRKLDNYIEVKEQELSKVDRKGFTIVEWGGTIK